MVRIEQKFREGRYRSLFLRFAHAMEGLNVSANAEGIIAAKVAELAAELEGAGVVNVSHVSLHVRLVRALVRAVGTGERRVALIHFACRMHMLL